MRHQAIALSFLTLALFGCGQPIASLSSPSITSQASIKSIPSNKAEFVKAVAALGVNLSDAQLAEISANRIAKPNGTWAPRPAVNLTAEQNLTVHFKKHRGEFKPSLADEAAYMAQAIELAEGRRGSIQYYFDTTSFKKGYQSKVIIWNSASKELTAMRPDGALTTYYHDNSIKPNRFVVCPIF